VALLPAIVIAGRFYLRRTTTDAPAYRASILLPSGVSLPTGVIPRGRFALSPDGRRLAFVGSDRNGLTRIWLQSLDSVKPQPLSGTEGANGPFWSPDSRFIGFRANSKIKKIDTEGGPAVTLADTTGQPGATWGRDDTILFGTFGTGNPIHRVPASGGASSTASVLDAAIGENYHAYPFFLPDGRHFLYLAVGSKTSGPATPSGIYVGEIGSNERKLLVPGGSSPAYSGGFLLFLREQMLMVQPFDVDRLELTGNATPLVDGIATGGASGVAAGFSVSENGVLAYQTGPAETGGNVGPLTQLALVDRSGRQIATLGDEARSGDVELSPDATRLAVSVFDTARRTRDVWLFNIPRTVRTRFTFDPADALASVWSPDGSRIIYNAARKGHLDLYERASSGAGKEVELLTDALDKYPAAWSPDGRFLLYVVVSPRTGDELWVLPLFGDRKPLPLLQTPFNEGAGRFSPDGRWIAYASDESGRGEVYVSPFPNGGGKWQISTAGGGMPRWRQDGKELFYLAPDGELIAASVNAEASAIQIGEVRPLFDTRLGGARQSYDTADNGQRFVINTLKDESASAPITLVVNWSALLKKP